jgi:hypothetical protein
VAGLGDALFVVDATALPGAGGEACIGCDLAAVAEITKERLLQGCSTLLDRQD